MEDVSHSVPSIVIPLSLTKVQAEFLHLPSVQGIVKSCLSLEKSADSLECFLKVFKS